MGTTIITFTAFVPKVWGIGIKIPDTWSIFLALCTSNEIIKVERC